MKDAKLFIYNNTSGKFDLQKLNEAMQYIDPVRLLEAEARRALGHKATTQEISELVGLQARYLYKANTVEPGSSEPAWKGFCFDVAGRQPLIEEVRREFPDSWFAKSSS